MLILVQETRAFLLCCVGILLFLSGCSGSQSATEPSQDAPEHDIVVHGTVVMLDGKAVPKARVRTVPTIQNMTADDNGKFIIAGPLRGVPREYKFIAEHSNKEEYPNLEGLANVRVEKRGMVITELIITLGREEDIKIELIGLEGRALPPNKIGNVTSGG